MRKRLCLPGISLRIEECTQCGASSGSSETLGENRSPHLLVLSVPVPVPVSVPAFPCLPVALITRLVKVAARLKWWRHHGLWRHILIT